MKKILITGATGFVGQNLVRIFDAEKYELYCVVRNEVKASTLLPTSVHIIPNDRIAEINNYGIY